MSVDPRFSRLVALSLAPILLVQARRLRRDIPNLPDAATPWHGALEGPDPVRILVLGDSTAAGVGVATQADGLPGNLARAILDHWGRGSTWNAVGKSGATARDIIERFLDEASEKEYDLVFVSIGANDALGGRPRSAFRAEVRTILRRLRATSPRALILMSSLPAFFRFSSLPNPLRWALYLHSNSLELTARRIAEGEPGVIMSPPPPPYTEGFFASDLFHPSAVGYRDWVEFALADSKLIPGAIGGGATGAGASGAGATGAGAIGAAATAPGLAAVAAVPLDATGLGDTTDAAAISTSDDGEFG